MADRKSPTSVRRWHEARGRVEDWGSLTSINQQLNHSVDCRVCQPRCGAKAVAFHDAMQNLNPLICSQSVHVNTVCLRVQAVKEMYENNQKIGLTKHLRKTSFRRMPVKKTTPTRQRRSQSRALKRKMLPTEKRYRQFFTPFPWLRWQQEDDVSPFEQPSPLKWVPSETTYGIGTM